SDVRGDLHAAHAALFRAARREAHADGRNGRVDAALCIVRARGAARDLLADRDRYPPPRRVLRLLLRDRADLRGQEIDARRARAATGGLRLSPSFRATPWGAATALRATNSTSPALAWAAWAATT